MFSLLHLLFTILAFISHEHEATAASYTTIVAPVTKHTDATKPLYSVPIRGYKNQYRNFIIDIEAPFIWYDCIVQLDIDDTNCPSNTICTVPVSCDDFQCNDVRVFYSYNNPSCAREPERSMLPGPGGVSFCTCPVNVVNPVTGSCNQAPLNYDEFTVRVSDGRNVLNDFYYLLPNAACAPVSSFSSFPANVSGVIAFSSSPYAVPALTYPPLKRAFALCFPSDPSARGVLFFGAGPYYLLPKSNVDIRSYISYTPLIIPQDSFGYFINVNSIVIKKRSVNIPANATTKLSTIDPYTVLRTDIYNGVVSRFSKVTKRLPPAKPVAPFGLCFSTSTTGLKVPDIDLILPNGKKWTVSTANSIKEVSNDVACLAFVDGGATSEPAIVVGTYLFQDNFLVFDLENSTLGFSSSLLRKRTSCANFSFTLASDP